MHDGTSWQVVGDAYHKRRQKGTVFSLAKLDLATTANTSSRSLGRCSLHAQDDNEPQGRAGVVYGREYRMEGEQGVPGRV